MRAALIRRNGPPEVLEIGEVPLPRAREREVLIRVIATSVNPIDCAVLRGGLRRFAGVPFPIVPGVDVSGVIEECGEDVSTFQNGDEVFAFIPLIGGAYAEFAACHQSWIAKKPAGLSHEEAAVLPCVGMTALQGIRDKTKLKQGESVLIVGASGGVGTMAVQIARAMGIEVTGVCSSANLELVRSLGASHVVDYMKQDPLTIGRRFDAVFDCVGHHTFWSYRAVLRRGGRHVGISCSRGHVLRSALSWLTPWGKSCQFHVKAMGTDLAQLSALVDSGKIRPLISHRYSLDEIAAAHLQSETGRTVGKISVTVSRP
jgi:NADPH:quinone reductase-like Zn-dependent oxidoreductase